MLPAPHFVDRVDAGRRLGVALLSRSAERPLVVLGLPRGGIPVAARVAEELHAPLDIFVVRKLGVPGHEELALGAIASGGAQVFNHDIVAQLRMQPELLERVAAREWKELHRRERAYRGDTPFPAIAGATVIVVDDGAATGASMHAAIVALRQLKPRAIIAAIPVASREAVRMFHTVADDCVAVIRPEPFYGVGIWYEDFSEVSDNEVHALLAGAHKRWEEELLARAGTTTIP